MRDLPSLLTRAKKISPSYAIAVGSAFGIPPGLAASCEKHLYITLKHTGHYEKRLGCTVATINILADAKRTNFY